jgi:acyl carrier protein
MFERTTSGLNGQPGHLEFNQDGRGLMTKAQGSIKDQIREYIHESAQYTGVTGLTDETPLVDVGVIDSVQLVRVVSFLEEAFGIHVADEEILPSNFANINEMERFVLTKLDGQLKKE